MFGHHDISQDYQPIASPNSFESGEEKIAPSRVCEQELASITTERNEVQFAGAVEAVESVGHGSKLVGPGHVVCDG